jgi:hypothetical protein
MNAGIDIHVDVQNPRVAAVLNFLTNGFGYFGSYPKSVIGVEGVEGF